MHNKKFPSMAAIFAAAATTTIFSAANFARAEVQPHLIINEVQTSGVTATDEFIELFNPTNSAIALDGYKLSKKTKSGSETTLLSSTTSIKFSGNIPAHGYFLITHPNFADATSADLVYASSYSIAGDNTILLYDKDGTLLDKVGFGAAADAENSPGPNPNASQSLERNNFSDTDDNVSDFSINVSPSPQNSSITETINEDDPSADGSGVQDEPTDDEVLPGEAVNCTTASENIKINEIFPYPGSKDEFIEVTNTGDDCVDVSEWKVMDGADHKIAFPENSIIEPGKYLYLEGNLYLNNDSDTAYLLDASGTAKTDALDSVFYEKTQKDFSYSFDGQNFVWSPTATPGTENIVPVAESEEEPAAETENISSIEDVFFNEILPNPKKNSDDEYIEIANSGSDSVDLIGWTIRDGSKSGKYIFKESAIIEAGEYLVLSRPQSKLALNNTDESLTLFDPQGEIASNVSYDKSIKDASYNFDGESWKWSKYLTPGKDNKFDSEPSMKINKPKSVYKNIFTEFSVKAKDKETKKLKYSWDFGDGRKSSLEDPTHKYLDAGKYTVTLSVTDDSQIVEKSFSLQVKKYPCPNIEIVKIVPNPTGNDSENETVEIKNSSKNKIALADWKIATGTGENTYNHPIIGEISLEPNETKTLTQEFSRFSLNNKAGKVSLVLPDGEIADAVEYAKEKIAEGEAYAKIDGEWRWIEPETSDENANETDAVNEEPASEDTADNGEVLGATNESHSNLSDYKPAFNSEIAYIFLSRINFLPSSQKETNYCSANNPSSNIAYLIASLI